MVLHHICIWKLRYAQFLLLPIFKFLWAVSFPLLTNILKGGVRGQRATGREVTETTQHLSRKGHRRSLLMRRHRHVPSLQAVGGIDAAGARAETPLAQQIVSRPRVLWCQGVLLRSEAATYV